MNGQRAPLLGGDDGGNDLSQYSAHHFETNNNHRGKYHHHRMDDTLDSEATTPPSSELVSEPPVPIPIQLSNADNIGNSGAGNIDNNSPNNNNNNNNNKNSNNQRQSSFSNNNNNNNNNSNNNQQGAFNTQNNSPYVSQSGQMAMSSAAILHSGSMSGAQHSNHHHHHIYSSGNTTAKYDSNRINNPTLTGNNNNNNNDNNNNNNNYNYDNNNFINSHGSSNNIHGMEGDRGRYHGTIPLIKQFTFIFIWFGILITIAAILTSIFLTIEYTPNDTNDSDTDTKENLIRNIRCVVIPLVIYAINAFICLSFYVESRRLQIHGYSILYSKCSQISKMNFRGSSTYFTLAFATYAFLSNVHSRLSIGVKTIDVVYAVLWFIAYIFVILCLLRFFYLFYNHNKLMPRPDLFENARGDGTQLTNSPNTAPQYATNNPKAVIQKLINDNKTLNRQLRNVSTQLSRTQRQLDALGQLKSSGKINVTTHSPRGSIDVPTTPKGGNTRSHHSLGDSTMYSSNNTSHQSDAIKISQYEDEIRKLKNQIRTLKATIKTCKSEIETVKTVLDTKKSECEQQKGLIANYERHIANLTQEKEQLESQYNQIVDQKNDSSILMQVKEEEIAVATNENKRLREQIMQMNQAMSNMQYANQQNQQYSQQQQNNRYQQR